MIRSTSTYFESPYDRFAKGFDLADLDPASVADLPGVCVRSDARRVTTALPDDADIRGRKAIQFCTGPDFPLAHRTVRRPRPPIRADDMVELLVDGGTARWAWDGFRSKHRRLNERHYGPP